MVLVSILVEHNLFQRDYGPDRHFTQCLFYWWGSDKGTYKATGTTWEESDGDIKSVLKHIHVERGGRCRGVLWGL